MRVLTRFFPLVCFLLVFLLLGVTSVLADSYPEYLVITINNTSTSVISPIVVLVSINNTQLQVLGYLNSTGLNSNIQLGGVSQEYSMADSYLPVWVSSGFASKQVFVYSYLLENSPGQSGFPIMVGTGGDYSMEDAATIELGQAFNVTADGYFSSGVAVNQTFIYKENAFREYIYGTNLTTYVDNQGIFMGSPGTGTGAVQPLASNQQFVAMNFTSTNPNYLITGAQLKCTVSTTVGNVRVGIRASDPVTKYPTGSDLAWGYRTSVSFPLGVNAYHSVNMTVPFLPTVGEEYWVYVACNESTGVAVPGGGLVWYGDNTNPYVGYGYVQSTNQGVTWGAWSDTNDLNFKLTTAPYVVTDFSTMTNSERTILVSGNTTSLGLYVDGVFKDKYDWLGTNGVLNNSKPWTIMNNEKVLYLDSLEFHVSGVQRLLHEPISIINTSVIPDRSGNGNTGTIRWGTNDPRIGVVVGALIIVEGYVAPVAEAPIPAIFGNLTGISFYENTSATGSLLPLFPLFSAAGVSLGWSSAITYTLIAFLIPSIAMAFAVTVATGSLWIGVGFGALMMGMAAGTGIIAPWLPFAILVGGLVIFFVIRRM